MYICSKCEKQIKAPSPVATYENKYYHPDCLTCSSCAKALNGKQFIKEKSGALVCEECNMKTAPKCKRCDRVFAPGVSYKKLGENVFYHKECFTCVGPCRAPIGADFYELDNEKYLCTQCYDTYGSDYDKQDEKSSNNDNLPTDRMANLNLNENQSNSSDKSSESESLPAVERERAREPKTSRFEPKETANKPATPSPPPKEDEKLCAKCNQKLFGAVTTFNNKNYHKKCFTCCQCNQEFKENSFFKLNGQPLCRTCHSKNLVENSSKCGKCAQPILDTVVTFKNAEYHDYCLVCTACAKKLVGQSIYTDKQDQPFCVECFTAKEGKYCAKCTKLIAPSQSSLVFDNKHFHKECFKCEKCSRVISSSESFYKSDESDDGVVCAECIDK